MFVYFFRSIFICWSFIMNKYSDNDYLRREKHKKNNETIVSKRKKRSSSNSGSDSDQWVEKESKNSAPPREDWMSMTGMMKTYTKEDLKPKRDPKEKQHIDSYNPSTSSRELNPYWKGGGSGLPQTPEEFRKSRTFIKPNLEDNYYTKPSNSRSSNDSRSNRDYYDKKESRKSDCSSSDGYYSESKTSRSYSYDIKSSNYKSLGGWRKESRSKEQRNPPKEKSPEPERRQKTPEPVTKNEKKDSKYLSDEKMNKLGAKIVKAEIMGNTKLANELKVKLEEAREYRKSNPNAGEEEEEGVLLTTMDSFGNARPLAKSTKDMQGGRPKRKAETHQAGERMKYFGNDDKYNLSQMFEQEKYGTNYDDEEQFAKIASKHRNPNDDLEDIFTDEISKNRDNSKDDQRSRDKAIRQHQRVEKSLDGCEYCLDSKNMLKHMMVSCGSKVYLALPARRSLVKGHCLISTIHHVACVTALDEDVWEEIMDYRKALTKYFNSLDQDVVFFETAINLHKFPHMVINCVPLPRDVGDMAAIYFKKALLECEAEWSMNKKVVELKGKGIRKGIPKGLPYFWVDFAMDPGFAHVIEDQRLFPKAFAEEIIGGFLDLEHNLWKNPKRDHHDQQRKKVLDFINEWKPYDTVSKR